MAFFIKSLLFTLVFNLCFWLEISVLASSPPDPYLLVLDIDDTLKITHVDSMKEALWNGVYGKSVYLGMSELVQILAEKAKSITYLSGSPQSLNDRLEHLLVEEYRFPHGEFILNNWLKFQSTRGFKAGQLQRMATQSTLPFLLIGDDTQSDPEVFVAFRDAQMRANSDGQPSGLGGGRSGRTTGIYIHQVKRRPLPDGVVGYTSAFDLALHEVEAGRIQPEAAIHLGEVIVNTQHPELLFPYFKVCPEDDSLLVGLSPDLWPVTSANAELVAESQKVSAFIRSYCIKRNSETIPLSQSLVRNASVSLNNAAEIIISIKVGIKGGMTSV